CPTIAPDHCFLRGKLRRAIVVAEKTTEALTAPDPFGAMLVASTIDEIVPEALVIAFAMIVEDVLGKRVTQVPLTERNETVQALFLDRANKPLRIRVAIWRANRFLDD